MTALDTVEATGRALMAGAERRRLSPPSRVESVWGQGVYAEPCPAAALLVALQLGSATANLTPDAALDLAAILITSAAHARGLLPEWESQQALDHHAAVRATLNRDPVVREQQVRDALLTAAVRVLLEGDGGTCARCDSTGVVDTTPAGTLDPQYATDAPCPACAVTP